MHTKLSRPSAQGRVDEMRRRGAGESRDAYQALVPPDIEGIAREVAVHLHAQDAERAGERGRG